MTDRDLYDLTEGPIIYTGTWLACSILTGAVAIVVGAVLLARRIVR